MKSRRTQHSIDALPGIRVTGWGPHQYWPETGVEPPDVTIAVYRGSTADGGCRVSTDVNCTAPQARALAKALIEAADAAETAPITQGFDAPVPAAGEGVAL